MSIPCENRVVCHSNNQATLKNIKKWFENDHSDYLDIESNDNSIWFNIDHDHGFPATMMQRMTKEVGNDEALQISVLTHDQGHEYIAHHQFKDCRWMRLYENMTNPLTERL